MTLRFMPPVIGICLLWNCLSVSEEDLYPPIDSIAPRVVKILPEDGWIQVPTGMEIKIWFSEAVDPRSINLHSVHLVTGRELVAASYLVSQDEDGRGLVQMRPLTTMIPGVVHRLRITTGVQDVYGNPLEKQAEVSFTTMR